MRVKIHFEGEENKRRAEWARIALNAFIASGASDEASALQDLLTDLMHLCDLQSNVNPHFVDALRIARDAYTDESSGIV